MIYEVILECMIPGEVTHIRIDAATKHGIQALADAGHRTFAAEARWALSWWVANGSRDASLRAFKDRQDEGSG